MSRALHPDWIFRRCRGRGVRTQRDPESLRAALEELLPDADKAVCKSTHEAHAWIRSESRLADESPLYARLKNDAQARASGLYIPPDFEC